MVTFRSLMLKKKCSERELLLKNSKKEIGELNFLCSCRERMNFWRRGSEGSETRLRLIVLLWLRNYTRILILMEL